MMRWERREKGEWPGHKGGGHRETGGGKRVEGCRAEGRAGNEEFRGALEEGVEHGEV